MKDTLKAATASAVALAAVIGFGALMAPEARAGEFCRRDVSGHMTGCGFDSMAQCQASSAGVGGDCFRDPYLNESKNNDSKNPKNAYAYHSRSSRARGGSRTAGMGD